MDLGMRDRVAVVTGGTSGIGLATVERFLAEEARVAFCARDAARVAATETGLAARFPGRVLGVPADILDPAAMTAFAAAIAARFGGADALILNAGASRMAAFDALDDAAWEDELGLKFFGVIRPVRAFRELLQASPAGAIVYVSSLLAKQPEQRLASTSAARAGALNLAKTLSFDLAAERVRFNTLLLGVIDSGQWERRYNERIARGEQLDRTRYREELAAERGIPLGRIGDPAEVAAAIAFLASPLSSFTTGAVLEVSGGFSRFI